MLIPTMALKNVTVSFIGLNAPQGFMLIPTYLYRRWKHNLQHNRLNAPQGFMLIPTIG